MDTRGLCWYQGSGSLESSGEGEKSALNPFMVIKTVNWRKMHNLKVNFYSGILLKTIVCTLSSHYSLLWWQLPSGNKSSIYILLGIQEKAKVSSWVSWALFSAGNNLHANKTFAWDSPNHSKTVFFTRHVGSVSVKVKKLWDRLEPLFFFSVSLAKSLSILSSQRTSF